MQDVLDKTLDQVRCRWEAKAGLDEAIWVDITVVDLVDAVGGSNARSSSNSARSGPNSTAAVTVA